MPLHSLNDTLTVVNGPEDGAEFEVIRSPFKLGRDDQCFVNIRLDEGVNGVMADATAIESGYRIRRGSGGPVYVDGKRVGVVRSQILRSGQTIRLGATELMLRCSPSGLASRSRGIASQSDFKHLFRDGISGALSVFTVSPKIFRKVFAFLRYFRRHWILTALAIAIVLYLTNPQFHNFALNLYDRAYDFVRGIIDRVNE